jgi:hypothetical protein
MRFAFVLVLIFAVFPCAASACVSFGKDQTAVDRVQSSWLPAARLEAVGDYAKALAELKATALFLPAIHNSFTRGCVAGGVNIREAEASAGATYLVQNPGDFAGAKTAAHVAWYHFPLRHDCP